MHGVSSGALRAAARSLPTGVTVVTSGRGDEVHGMTVNSFATLSLSPPLVTFSVQDGARIERLIESCAGFVVNILSTKQVGLARWFASRDRPWGIESFSAVETAGNAATGGVRLAGTVGWFVCTVVQLTRVGDHTLVIGAVTDCGAAMGEAEPLVFGGGGFHALGSPVPETAERTAKAQDR
ncbi:flavin reductase family protein [Streptomyces sp. NPDC058812]|uniref:flavin reductase family protein n=1 Tax=unclassified Streptomyces TaxID=2593676 RepID=UPI0036C0BF3C